MRRMRLSGAIDILANNVNHSMGEEIDDSVDLTPGDMFHHIVVYWGRCIQFP